MNRIYTELLAAAKRQNFTSELDLSINSAAVTAIRQESEVRVPSKILLENVKSDAQNSNKQRTTHLSGQFQRGISVPAQRKLVPLLTRIQMTVLLIKGM
jgi:hypothetical protein